MKSKKVCLVTGGAGFIGSHVCEALLSSGHRVICVDNLISGTTQNISALEKNPDFTFIKFDITVQLSGIVDVDYVFHLASPASVVDYQNYPEETALANSEGTRLLLKLSRAAGAKFLFASTSEVYGDPLEHPQKESYWGNVNPSGERACYDESKRYGEMITMLYYRKYGVDVRIIRIFNTYGPKMRKNDGRVISNFINQAMAGEPITVYGDGTQTRSFCFVSDMVDAIQKAMFSKKTSGETINVGNPTEITVRKTAEMIKEKTGSSSKLVYGKLPSDDPKVRKPDISKAKKLLSWTPKISLEEGLERTIEFYQKESV